MCVRERRTIVHEKAGVAITPKDRSFIWLLNAIFFFETRWHDLFPLPIHTLTVASTGKYFHRVKSIEKVSCCLYKDVWYMLR
jgi:hypothetical protein